MATSPGLFRRCRDALGLSAQGIADALHIAEGRTVRRWEAGDSEIPGPVWVALRYLLRDAGRPDLAGEVDAALGDRA